MTTSNRDVKQEGGSGQQRREKYSPNGDEESESHLQTQILGRIRAG